VGVARLIFSDHVLTMELTGALLITAALGAVTLTHRDRLTARLSQRDVADAKMRAFAERGASIAQQPAPGVYARSNAASVPALSAAGQPIEDSVPRVLRIRGQQVSIGEVAPQVVEAVARRRGATPAADVPQSGLPGMPGEPPPALPAARQAPALTENAEDGNR
jgi:NADH-quinone oxidoreductase subunit J